MADCFYLDPPRTVRRVPDPDGTRIFRKFLRTTPKILPLRTKQGLYTMTPDGQCMSGRFAAHSNTAAWEVIDQGLEVWEKIASSYPAKSTEEKTAADEPLSLAGGKFYKGYLKLRVSYRDLPRGDTERPGFSQHSNPYNLGWYRLPQRDAVALLQKEDATVWKKLVKNTLKDSVRGQMPDWKDSDWRDSSLRVTHVGTQGGIASYRIQSRIRIGNTRAAYAPTVYGKADVVIETGEFLDFQLLASGQRAGKGAANGRTKDHGPAPLGVALRLIHEPKKDSAAANEAFQKSSDLALASDE